MPALLALSACSGQAEPTGRLRTFLGDDLIRVIGGATRVEVFRISSGIDAPLAAMRPETTLNGYTVNATAPEQGTAFAARLTSLLFDPGSYDFGTMKSGCGVVYSVAFRLWRGDEHADVLVCFFCDVWQIVTEPAGKARVSVSENCDRARPELLRLAREAFPDDPVLKGLRANR